MPRLYLLLLICFLVTLKGDDITISIENMSPAPAEINIIEGNQLNLTCSSNKPSTTYTWNSDVSGFASTFGANLYIPTLTRRHSGSFQCVTGSNVSAEVEVTVLYPPLQPYITGSLRHIVHPDLKFFLYCITTGNPSPSITWAYSTDDAKPTILYHGIEYKGYNDKDDAWIRCYAESTLVPTVGHAIYTKLHADRFLDILHPVDIVQLPSNISGKIGATLEVVCEVFSDPVADVWWTRNQEDWIFRGSTLRISPLTERDLGLYTCHANNTMEPSKGSPVTSYDEQSISIYVLDQSSESESDGRKQDTTSATDDATCITDTNGHKLFDNIHIGLFVAAGTGWCAFVCIVLWVGIKAKRSENKDSEEKSEEKIHVEETGLSPPSPHRSLPDITLSEMDSGYVNMRAGTVTEWYESIQLPNGETVAAQNISVSGHTNDSSTTDGNGYLTPTE